MPSRCPPEGLLPAERRDLWRTAQSGPAGLGRRIGSAKAAEEAVAAKAAEEAAAIGLCLSFAQNRENFVFSFRASAPKFRQNFREIPTNLSHTLAWPANWALYRPPRDYIASSAQCGGSWQHPPPRAPILRSAALVRQDGAMAVLPIGRWIQEGQAAPSDAQPAEAPCCY